LVNLAAIAGVQGDYCCAEPLPLLGYGQRALTDINRHE
jgi:hypothetical protein